MVDVDFTILSRAEFESLAFPRMLYRWAEATDQEEGTHVVFTAVRQAAVPAAKGDFQVVYNTKTRHAVVVEVREVLIVSNGDGDEQAAFVRYLCAPAEWVAWSRVLELAGADHFGDV